MKSLRIEITGKCNLQCLYCHAARLNTADARADELSTPRILELIDEARGQDCREFTLIGGEPFLNRDWVTIAQKCGNDSVVNITTNGHFFDDETVDALEALPQVQELRISLDGLASHDLVRRGSNHRLVLAAAAKIVCRFPQRRVVVQTTCNQRNLSELLNLYEALKEIGIFRWRISQLWRYGRTRENEGLLEFADYDEMFDVYRRLLEKYHADGKPFRLGIYNVYNSQITAEQYVAMDPDTHPCLYHFGAVCVKANGELTFCPALDIPFASVKTQSITQALQSEWLSRFQATTVRSVACGNCRYIKLCGGGCRADAYAWTNDIGSLDPVSCCLMVRVERCIVPILAADEQVKYHELINLDGDWPPVTGRNAEEAVRAWEQSTRGR